MFAGDAFAKFAEESVANFTKETRCISSWNWGGGTNAVCLWEAPDEQALIEFFAARTLQVPVNGIYPVQAVDWPAPE